jgi:hypothetical protein
MADFAIVNNGVVVNVIVADDEATAEAVTGFDVLPVVGGVPGMGWTLEAEGWRQPAPFPSWEWNGTAWAAPVLYPEDGSDYYWDEQTTSWVKISAPESSAE